MRHLALCAAIAFATLTGPAAAYAGKCDSAEKYAAKFKAAADKICEYGDWEDCNKNGDYLTEAAEWVSWWNQMVGDSWAKLGPRSIDFRTTMKGTLLTPGKRLWVSTTPSELEYGVVRIDKIDGKAGGELHLCTIDDDGEVEWVASKSIPKGKDNQGKTYWLRDTEGKFKGKFLVVDFVSKGKVGTKLEYEIRVQTESGGVKR